MSDAAVQQEISLESLVAQVVDEFRERQKRGEKPDVEEYAARHPQAAELLRKVLASWQLIGLSEAGALAAQGAAPDEPVSGILGDFRLLREVGRGGMGVVYEAEQISLGRRVALKVLPFAATMDSRQLQRFQNEARAAAGLHHTNIVPVHYVGSERGVHYYAMQYIEGRDLASVIAQLREQSSGKISDSRHLATVDAAAGEAVTPSVSPAAATKPLAGLSTERSTKSAEHFRAVARLGIQAAEALDHAHQMGIVHRDIKPANLLVDDTGRLWVTDFGLAQMQSDARLTMTGDLVGTLRYMSPEQALAKRVVVDHRTDVYSLGATLYELLTLQPAFDGKDRQELLRQIAFEEPRPLRHWNGSLPRELETIVLKAMERNPADRYATAQELADDLRCHLEDKAIRARRPSWRQVTAKWVRRHKAVMWAAAVVLLVTLLFGCGMGVWWLQQRAVAEQQRASASGEAESALSDADRLQNEGKLPEAMWAIRRAEPLRSAGLLNEELARRVQERQTDLEMLDRLEDIRLEQAVVKDEHFDYARADPAYELAFQDYGIDVLRLDPEEAAKHIKAKSIRVEIAAALQDWAMVCRNTRPKEDTTCKTLLAIARAIDPDDWRNLLRDALEQKDKSALIELADSKKTAELLPISLVLLGRALGETGALNEAANLLLKAQRQYPGDFWINCQLMMALRQWHPKREEALAFARVALALRPHNPLLYVSVGYSLYEQGRLEEAKEEFLKAIPLDSKYAQAHVSLGDVLINQGRNKQAEAEYRLACAINPKYAPPRGKLGDLLMNQGRLREAMAEFDKLAELDPFRANGDYSSLGRLLYLENRLEEAKEVYRKASTVLPNDPGFHFSLGGILYEQGQLEEAQAELQKSIQLEANKGNTQQASTLLRACDRLLALRPRLAGLVAEQDCPTNQAERLEFAFLCQRPSERRYALATRLYTDAFVADPKLADNWDAPHRYNAACAAALAGCGQGEDAAKLDDKEKSRLRGKAQAWLRADQEQLADLMGSSGPAQVTFRVLKRQPGQQPTRSVWVTRTVVRTNLEYWQRDSDLAGVRGAAIAKLPKEEQEAWRQLWADVADTLLKTHAKTTAQQQQEDKAKQQEDKAKEFRKTIELDPENANAHNGLAEVLSDQDKWVEAEKEYRKVIALNPALAAPHNSLGKLLEGRSITQKKAEAEYRKAIALDPKDARYHDNLGMLLWTQYRLEEAAEEFRRAIEFDPKHARYHFSLGYTLAEQGRRIEGEAEYRKAIALDPTGGRFHNSLGFFLKNEKRLEEAEAEYRKAIELDPKNDSHNALGDVLKDQGRLEEAKAEYRKAMELRGMKDASTQLQTCERQLALRPRLPDLAAGIDRPANQVERLEFALLCQEPFERRYALSAQLYADAFAADPNLADNGGHRYKAACAAALAGCGRGEDTPKLDDKEKGRLRNQALAWLRADQQQCAVPVRSSNQPWIQARQLGRWQIAPDLEGVRGDAIAKLPQEEQKAWRQLWADVTDMLKKAATPKP